MKIISAILMVLLLSTSASAFTVCFEWTENPQGTIGYRLYEDGKAIQDIPYGTTETCVTWATDLGCKDYTLTAYDNYNESSPAGPLNVCMIKTPEGYKRMVLIN